MKRITIKMIMIVSALLKNFLFLFFYIHDIQITPLGVKQRGRELMYAGLITSQHDDDVLILQIIQSTARVTE